MGSGKRKGQGKKNFLNSSTLKESHNHFMRIKEIKVNPKDRFPQATSVTDKIRSKAN